MGDQPESAAGEKPGGPLPGRDSAQARTAGDREPEHQDIQPGAVARPERQRRPGNHAAGPGGPGEAPFRQGPSAFGPAVHGPGGLHQGGALPVQDFADRQEQPQGPVLHVHRQAEHGAGGGGEKAHGQGIFPPPDAGRRRDHATHLQGKHRAVHGAAHRDRPGDRRGRILFPGTAGQREGVE